MSHLTLSGACDRAMIFRLILHLGRCNINVFLLPFSFGGHPGMFGPRIILGSHLMSLNTFSCYQRDSLLDKAWSQVWLVARLARFLR